MVTGFIATVLAAFVDLTILIEICYILVLLPYLLFYFISIMLLRYKEHNKQVSIVTYVNVDDKSPLNKTELTDVASATGNLRTNHPRINILFEGKSKLRIIIALLVLFLSSAGFALVVRFGISYELGTLFFATLCIIFALPMLVSTIVIYRTPHQVLKFPFTMPMFPILPMLCVFLCTFVMFSMWA